MSVYGQVTSTQCSETDTTLNLQYSQIMENLRDYCLLCYDEGSETRANVHPWSLSWLKPGWRVEGCRELAGRDQQ